MNERCTACFGSGKFGACGASGDNCAERKMARPCNRCNGTGLEPMDELIYVRVLNRRVADRITRSQAAA